MDSFIAWIGGKKRLRGEIIRRFPKDGVDKYVEPFGGAGWVLFGKEPHKREVYNDINGELVNLFRMAKHHPDALQAELDWQLNSREEFVRQRAANAETLTELQRAARMLYLIRVSYGAKMTSFGGGFRDVSAVKNLREVHERLKRVLIENQSFEEIIAKHDGAGTLFYLDPPYHGTERLYRLQDGFGEDRHRRLAELLRQVKGRWILSYNDDAFVRELYRDFAVEEVQRANDLGAATGKGKVFREMIVRNF